MDRIFYKLNYEVDLEYPVYTNTTNFNIVMEELINTICLFIYNEYVEKNLPIPKFCLWCRGSSGISISSIIANRLPNYINGIVYVRKKQESFHLQSDIISDDIIDNSIHIFVDDFTATGTTLQTVYDFAMTQYNIEITGIWVLGKTKVTFPSIKYIISNSFYTTH